MEHVNPLLRAKKFNLSNWFMKLRFFIRQRNPSILLRARLQNIMAHVQHARRLYLLISYQQWFPCSYSVVLLSFMMTIVTVWQILSHHYCSITGKLAYCPNVSTTFI